MGIEEKCRTTLSSKEIVNALINIQVEATQILIWQNIAGIRLIANAIIANIDFSTDSIVLVPFSPIDKKIFEKFNPGPTFYIRGLANNIIFKQEKAVAHTKNYLIITIPNGAKMSEMRNENRIFFDKTEKKTSALIFPGGQINVSTKAIHPHLCDVSSTGMGLCLDKKHMRFFFEKDKIRIDRISNYKFPRSVIGEIVYATNNDDRVGRIRVGVRFNEMINLAILDAIS